MPAALSGNPEWTDPTRLPTSSRESRANTLAQQKVQDPLLKDGVVGLFNRVFYPVTRVLEEFLSDVYEPTANENRWHLIASKSIAGVEVIDDKFVYSHHAKDPAYMQLCNAFDIVRIHKFGSADDKASFRDMCEFAMQQDEVKILATNERLADAQTDFNDEDEDWTPRVLFLAEKVLVMDYAFYDYRRRAGSVSTSLKVRDLHGMGLVMRSLFAFYVQHKNEVTPDIANVWQRSWLSLFFLIFFEPRNQRGITEKVRRTELRNLFEGEGLDNFKQFIKLANLPKRIAAPLILLGRWYTLPACLYFKLIYYPLVKLRGA